MADVEAILNMSPDSHGKHNDHNNDHSVRGTTTSSRDTAPSTGPRSQPSTHSETCTTPSHSRMQSPVRHHPRPDMEEDLAGIGTRGCQTDQYVDDRSCTTLPSRPLQHQPTTTHPPLDIDSTTSHVDDWSLDEESCLSDDREHIIRRGSGTLTPHGSSPISCSDGLTSLGEMFEDTTYTITEGSDSQSDSVDDSDVHLERLAGDLLSEWFGININSLERPIRVIHCLEQIKDQMAAVVEEEGHSLPEDGTDDTEMDEMFDADLPEIQPRNGESTGQATPHGRSQAGEGSSRSGADKKRLSSGDLKSSTSSKLKTAERDPRKKGRTGTVLSCPYRKHNPYHFNIRQYERCALRSYANMTYLKKHLLSDHYRPRQSWRTCERCQQRFEDQNSAIEHMQQCPAAPQPANVADIAGPMGVFDDDVKNRLISRNGKKKIDDWNSLWDLLFPGTTIIPDPDFEPVFDYYDISATAKGDNTMNTEARDHFQWQHQMLFEKTKSNWSGYQQQNDTSYHRNSTDNSGESSMFSPEGFVYVRPQPPQPIEPLGDVLAVEQVPAHYTPNGGPMSFLNSSQVSQRSHSQVLGSTPLIPDLSQLDSQPQSTQPLYNSFVTSMVPQQEQTANYLMGLDTRFQVLPDSSDGLFMGIDSLNAPPTYVPRLNNTGIRNSATWPSADTDFDNGQVMSWDDGTLSYQDVARRG